MAWRRPGVALSVLWILLLSSCQKTASRHYQVPLPVPANAVEWTALNVSVDGSQADANLIRFASGETTLIDAGDVGGNLLAGLDEEGVTAIDKVFISHPHKDHYRGLRALLSSSISLNKVYLNIPDSSLCASESGWGCDYADIEDLIRNFRARGISIQSMQKGDILVRDGDIALKVLYAFDGINTPVGGTDINDTSVIISLKNAAMKVLFTGDLNSRLGTYLAGLEDPELQATLLKVPHHGTEGVAPNAFFERVNPKLAFIPSPQSLWNSQNSKRVRDWLEGHAVSTYVSGLSGKLKVYLYQDRFEVLTPRSLSAR